MTSNYLTLERRSESEARADIAISRASNVVRLETETKEQILRRHTLELNALIRKADAAFAEKVGRARNEYARLLRALPWDFQKDQREHEFIVHCEELIGSGVGEQMAWDIMARGGIT